MNRWSGLGATLLVTVSAALGFQGTAQKLKLDKSVVRYYRPVRIELKEKAAVALTKEPEYKGKVRYGVIKLGDATENQVVVALDEPADGKPTLYLDRNANGDLTDDGDAAWGRELGQGSDEKVYLKDATVTARYADGSAAEYPLSFYRFSKRLPDVVLYYRNAARIGEIKLGEVTYRVALVEETATARFDDLKNTTVVVDVDRDGKFDGASNSAETYKADEPFNVGGVTYEIKRVSASGDEVEIVISDKTVAAKTIIAIGQPAPQFVTKDLEGRPLDFPNTLKGKVVLLDFWATW